MTEEEVKKEGISDSCDSWAGKEHGKHKHHHHHHHNGAGYAAGPVWFIGWLFTIGYLHLPFFWKGVLAIVIWPYYLGNFLRSVAGY